MMIWMTQEMYLCIQYYYNGYPLLDFTGLIIWAPLSWSHTSLFHLWFPLCLVEEGKEGKKSENNREDNKEQNVTSEVILELHK